MDVTKPYEFIGFGAMDVIKPYEFIGFAQDRCDPLKCAGIGRARTCSGPSCASVSASGLGAGWIFLGVQVALLNSKPSCA